MRDRKILTTWNIRHGGGTASRLRPKIDRLLAFRSDVLVVTEFRNNESGRHLKSALAGAGYELSHPPQDGDGNTILLASRAPILAEGPLDPALPDLRHLWVADLGWIRLCAVYMPLGRDKLPYWESLLRSAEDGQGPSLVMGDFNTGNNILDVQEGGTPFILPQMFDNLGQTRLKDVWRTRHPDRSEYSWLSPRLRKGFRLDHVFADARLLAGVVRCVYLHETRLQRLSDHSALQIELDVGPNPTSA